MKKKLTLALIGSGLLILASAAYGKFYFDSLTATEKCALVSRIELGESVLDRSFYDEKPNITRFCAVINKE